MGERAKQVWWRGASLPLIGAFVLAGLAPLCGCQKKEETATGTGGKQVAAGADQGSGTAGGTGAGGAGGRRGGGGMGQTGAFGGGQSAGGTGGGAQAAAPAPAPAPSPPPKLSEADRAKKIRDFAKVHGPITLAYENNWDDRILEWVTFSYEGRQIKMPLSMVLDAPDQEELAAYFTIYTGPVRLSEGTQTWTITATSGVPPAAKQPPPIPAPSRPAVTTAAAGAGAQAPAGGGGGRGGGGGGGRGGRRGGRGMGGM